MNFRTLSNLIPFVLVAIVVQDLFNMVLGQDLDLSLVVAQICAAIAAIAVGHLLGLILQRSVGLQPWRDVVQAVGIAVAVQTIGPWLARGLSPAPLLPGLPAAQFLVMSIGTTMTFMLMQRWAALVKAPVSGRSSQGDAQ